MRSLAGHETGTTAEDALEVILIEHFGEPYVHTQKRYYKDHKNRYDFFVYFRHGYMGIDIFTTSRIEYIGPNIRHKLNKYRIIPAETPLYFIVASDTLTAEDVEKGAATARGLVDRPNIKVMHLSQFITIAMDIQPLKLPSDIKLVLQYIEQI